MDAPTEGGYFIIIMDSINKPHFSFKVMSAATLAGVTLAGASALYFFNPWEVHLFPGCPFLAITGFYCPGCGGIRAAHQLLHGDLISALQLNIFVVALAVYLIWRGLTLVVARIKGRKWSGLSISAGWQRAVLGALLIYTIVRNIPLYPFNLLAP